MLFTAGRTPIFEEGRLGARDSEIHWAQEMFDQAGMLRELVKWDYELRDGAQLDAVVDRALAIATAHPQGPVYLSLPREVLAAKRACRAACRTGPYRRAGARPGRLAELAVALARRPHSRSCSAPQAAPIRRPAAAELHWPSASASAWAKRARATCTSRPAIRCTWATTWRPSTRRPMRYLFLESDVPWLPAKRQPAGRPSSRMPARPAASRAIRSAATAPPDPDLLRCARCFPR